LAQVGRLDPATAAPAGAQPAAGMPLIIEETPEEQSQDDFRFHYLPETKFCSFGNQTVQPLLDKWGFGKDMCMATFRVEQPVREENFQVVLESFFRNREVLGILHHMTRMRVISPDKVRVYSERMQTKAVSMSFLNRFEECGAIGKEGHIRGRIEEDYEGVPITDLIREVIMMEESELYDTFSEQERKEFLFRIFSHLIFGGASNQFEDHVEEYFRVTKAVYKDLLAVKRNDAGDVQVLSMIASVKSLGEGGSLFGKDDLRNFCYVIADPLMRHITVWYFGYRSMW